MVTSVKTGPFFLSVSFSRFEICDHCKPFLSIGAVPKPTPPLTKGLQNEPAPVCIYHPARPPRNTLLPPPPLSLNQGFQRVPVFGRALPSIGHIIVMSTEPGILSASQTGHYEPGPRVREPARGPPENLFRLRAPRNEECRIEKASIIRFVEKSKIRSLRTPLPSQPVRLREQIPVKNLCKVGRW